MNNEGYWESLGGLFADHPGEPKTGPLFSEPEGRSKGVIMSHPKIDVDGP
jgi:hypothetical protein